MVAKISKRVKKIESLLDYTSMYSFNDFFEILNKYKDGLNAKYDESVDVCFGMNVDTKKSDQTVKSFVELPHGNGRKVVILVFANDENIDKALKAGATYAGGDELIADVASGKISNFDRCIATPTMMPKLAKLAKILGPKGLMPNPKLGTVVVDVKPIVESMLKGRIDFKADKEGYIKLSVARLSFDKNKIMENIKETYNSIKNAKPSGVKSNYFKSLHLSSSAGLSIGIKLSEVYNII